MFLLGVFTFSAFAQQVSNLQINSVSPRFIKSVSAGGTTVTINVSANVAATGWNGGNGYWAATISQTDGFGASGSQYLNLSGGSNQTLVNWTGAQTQIPAIPGTSQTASVSVSRNVSFNIPASWSHGDVYYLHITAGSHNGNWPSWDGTINGLQSRQTTSVKIEVIDNIDIMDNIAFVGEKFSKALLYIIKPAPRLDVIATPPGNNGGTHKFSAKDIDVTLKAVAKGGDNDGQEVTSATIYYSINNPNDSLTWATDPSNKVKLDASLFATTDTVHLYAYAKATGGAYDPSPIRHWIYIRELPDLCIDVKNYTISALSKDESGRIIFDTQIFGVGVSELEAPRVPVPENGLIKLTITAENGVDTTGKGIVIKYTTPGDPTVHIYDHSVGIKVSQTGTLTIWTESDWFSLCNGERYAISFVQELKSAKVDLWLETQYCPKGPANHPVQIYGAGIGAQIKFPEADTKLKYIIADEYEIIPADTATYLMNYGTEAKDNETIMISGGTMFVIVYTYGSEIYEPGIKVWKFVQQNIGDVVVAPEGRPNERKFTGSLPVTITPNAADAGLCGFNIYYTLSTNGTEPVNPIDADGKPNIAALKYTVAIDMNTIATPANPLVIMKVAAFSELRLPIAAQTHKYRLTASGKNAWFYDVNPLRVDGAIDKVTIETTIPVTNVPDKVIIVSPWNETDTTVIAKDGKITYSDKTTGTGKIELSGNSKIVITADKYIFPFNGETGFTADLTTLSKPFGMLSGAEYTDNQRFTIGDSIAPVPVKAEFRPGQIQQSVYEKTGDVVRDADTLVVEFSEPTTRLVGDKELFAFERKDGTPYTMELTFLGAEGRVMKFTTPSDKGDKPIAEDSLSSKAGSIKDDKNVTQQHDTKWIPIIVFPDPYLLIIKGVTPFFPNRAKEPVVVADFLTKFDYVKIPSGRILDAIGNLVGEFDENSTYKDNLYAEILTNSSTKILVKWNAKNQVGRDVGAGAYLILLTIEGPDGQVHNRSIKVGVTAAQPRK